MPAGMRGKFHFTESLLSISLLRKQKYHIGKADISPCVKDLRKQVLFSTKFALRASEMRCAREILLRNVICLRVVSTRIESKTHIAEMIGVSPQSVSKWERGDTYPDITLLPALANLFKVLAILDKDMSQPEIEDAYLRFLHLGKKL